MIIDTDAVDLRDADAEYPLAISQYTMSRIMAVVELPGVYGQSIQKTIRAICAQHTEPTQQEIRLGFRKLRKVTGHCMQTLVQHMWTLIEDIGLLRRVPETGTLKTGELRVYWGTDLRESRGRRRPVPGIAPRTPPPATYLPLFPGLYRTVNLDRARTRNRKPKAKNIEKGSRLLDARSSPVKVQLRQVAKVLSARLGLPSPPLHGGEPSVIDPVWDGHPLSAVRPDWLRVLTRLLGTEFRVLPQRDRRIARVMAVLPIPLVTVRSRTVLMKEGRRQVHRTQQVWRRTPVTRADLDQILATLPDQGAAVKARAAKARASRGQPHVSQTRKLVPIFEKLAKNAPKRRRLRMQARESEVRHALVAAQIREDGLKLLAPQIARERARTLPIRPPDAPDVNDIIPLTELRAFQAKHAVADADERLEDLRYLRSQAQFDRHRNDPEPEPIPTPDPDLDDENTSGEAAAVRLGFGTPKEGGETLLVY